MAGPRQPASGAGFAVRRDDGRPRRPGLRRALLAAALLAVTAGGMFWLDHSGTFAIERVETGTYRFTDAQVLESRLVELLGRRLWLVDQAEVETALADLPWLRQVVLRRRLPATLKLELTEWRPLVAVAGESTAAGPQVLLGDGRVVPFPAHLPPPALPVLVGVPTTVDSLGAVRLEPGREGAVTDLLAAMEASGLESACPVDFLVARDEGYAIVLQEGEGTLLVGREDFVDRLERYLFARDHLEKGLEVELRFGDSIYVLRPGS
ncbi:MAG: FtsQ-type POTRA domain-containing protein [bacterium]|nr:FtsQ-type POTRA domain-containing protein [bacterium]